MQTTTSQGVKCGNTKVHGRERATYHATSADVKACYAARYAGGTYTEGANSDAYWDREMQRKERREDERVAYDKLMRDLASDSPDEDRRSEREARRSNIDISNVGAGWYAVDHPEDGVLRFLRVDTPDEGKWRGYRFVKIQASDDFYKLGSQRPNGRYYGKSHALVRALAQMTDEERYGAMARYGREIGACGVCNRTLTDETSRKLGIGPVCRSK